MDNNETPSTNNSQGYGRKIRANKTPLLIVVLAVLTGILVMVALSPNKSSAPSPTGSQQAEVTPQEATLTFGNATSSGSINTVDVILNTGNSTVTAVQLEMSFDPKMISNVSLKKGDFVADWDELTPTKIDYANGRISYVLGVPLNGGSVKGSGSVASITFTEAGAKGQQVEIKMLPKSLVSIEGYSGSSLKSTSDFMKVIGTPSSATPTGQ